jgi:cytidyltransferase-like protein
MKTVVVSGSFDNLKSSDFRFLEEAAKLGPLTVFLWSDAVSEKVNGSKPKFSQTERCYFVEAVRFVEQVIVVDDVPSVDKLPSGTSIQPEVWIVFETADTIQKRYFCTVQGIEYKVLRLADLAGFPNPPRPIRESSHPKVIVTGCYDWFHSGHVRFFEETTQLGDLYVIVGHDENVRLLKGNGHPMYSEDERRYMAGSIRFVTQALVSSGSGWMDSEPEIEKIQPDIYAVNEDGDKPEKRAFCEQHGLEYAVLKRTPATGLPPRSSTNLRGF